ncbi:nucleopolyhedrovirus P10 family protein [Streptomyces griseocarneus]|nr:nucleopolyhedrovirus P10 family protein [Streptomyces griseocarneus]
MTADPWALEVRRELALGRLLPLGGAADGCWIAESAAARVLRRAAATLPDVRVGALRLDLADPATAVRAGGAPPSALPVGPLRVTADFAAVAGRPLPPLADALRTVLWETAAETLGLSLTAVDLRVTELLDHLGEADDGGGPAEPPETSTVVGGVLRIVVTAGARSVLETARAAATASPDPMPVLVTAVRPDGAR